MAEDKTEKLITGVLLITIIFLTLTFELSLGAIFVGMILFSIWVSITNKGRTSHNAVPNNTLKAIGIAGGALLALMLVILFVSTALQGLLNLQEEPSFQSIIRSGFSTTGLSESQPIFAGSVLLTIITFGVVIATVETRFIGRVMDWLSDLTGINVTKFNFKTIALFTIIASVFVFYHSNVKGVTDNTALLITFIFAMISLGIIAKTGELESATYLHIFNNVLFIYPRVTQSSLEAQAIVAPVFIGILLFAFRKQIFMFIEAFYLTFVPRDYNSATIIQH